LDAGAERYAVAVVARDRDLAKAHAPTRVHNRNLRAAGTEHERRGRHLHQIVALQLERNVDVHTRHQGLIGIRQVDFDTQRARLRIDRLRCARDLRVERSIGQIACTNLYRTPGLHEIAGRALRHIDEYTHRTFLADFIERRIARRAAGRHEIAD